MEASRSINHETEPSCSSTNNCNTASIIQNPSIRYDLRKPQSSKTSAAAAANVLLHSSSSRYDNNGSGGDGGGESSKSVGGGARSKSSDRSSFHTLHYGNSNDITITNRKMHTANSNRQRRARRTTSAGGMHDANNFYSSKSSASSSYSSECSASSCDGSNTSSNSSDDPNLPYPGFPALSMNYLTQDMRPRNWCLLLITNPWFERISILVILFNCVTLGMYQPCVDDDCVSNRCKILQVNVPRQLSLCLHI